MTEMHWRISADTGGTFTDCLAVAPDGTRRHVKVLSTGTLRASIRQIDGTALHISETWGADSDILAGAELHLFRSNETRTVSHFDPSSARLTLTEELADALPGDTFELRFGVEAPVLAARLATGTPAGKPLPRLALRVATTRGTNALLERRGIAPVLFITEGFGDLLEIGTQARPDLFALGIEKPTPLHASSIETDERLDAQGNVLLSLSEERFRRDARKARAKGHKSAAVAFLHSWLNSAHERHAESILREEGFEHVSLSSVLSPTQRILPRAQTAVVDAYLAPVIEAFVQNVREGIGRESLVSLHVMTSAGGLQNPDAFHAKDSLLSGPAGGVVGAAAAAQQADCDRVIAFDMGGTSTDVSRWDGALPYLFEHRVGDAHLVAPALAIETVAAGGGSICSFDGYRLRVGPESAGATPGPACYGAGGPLTITDVNLLLGRLTPERFGIPVDRQAARNRLEELRGSLPNAIPEEELLTGFLRIANERMAEAVRRVSVREGYRPADYTLLSFGGAGGQHACELAELLGITRILAPAEASLLSAVGLHHASIERIAERDLHARLDTLDGGLDPLFGQLAVVATRLLREEEPHLDAPLRTTRRMASIRLTGQEVSITLDLQPGEDPRAAFLARYREQYGYEPEDRPLEVQSLRVAVSAGGEVQTAKARDSNAKATEVIRGPSLIHGMHTTLYVADGWSGQRLDDGSIMLTRETTQS